MCGSRPRMRNRSAAHGAEWQDLELIFRRLLQHRNMRIAQSHACVAYTMVKSVLLRWTSSLNDRSKLMGQYIDVKSGFGISVGPSLKPTVSVKTKFS